MYTGTYKIAEKIVKIQSVFEDVQKLCSPYKWEGNPDLIVVTDSSDIAFERARGEEGEGTFSDGYLETLAVYRKLCDKMLACDTILFHGSVIAVDNEAYLFTATSGTGKSTHTRFWRQVFGKRALMVNDDKPLLKVTKDGVFASGTPWDGKHHLSTNVTLPLKAICILERGEENEIHTITAKEALPMLLQQSYHPPKQMDRLKFLTLLDLLTKKVDFYNLHCNMSEDAAKTAYEGMQK